MFKKIVLAIAVALYSLPATAETSNFVNLGFDKENDPVLIDDNSIAGDNFTLYQSKGGRMVERVFDANCPETRVWLRRVTLYSSNGVKLAEDTSLTAMPNSRDTPSGAGLRYFCRKFNVPGY